MKIISNYQKKVINENGNIELTFEVSDFQSKALVEELQKDTYKLDITKPQSKRTLQQNAYMWAMIHELATYNNQEPMEVYIQALEESNAKYEYVWALPSIAEELNKNFRAVKVVKKDEIRGKSCLVYKCFIGSSKFSKEEMTKLVDTIKNWCIEYNIPVNEKLYR